MANRDAKGRIVNGLEEGNTFSSTNQPGNQGRKPNVRAWKDVLADMMPEEGYLSFNNVQEIGEDGKPTGNVFKAARVKMATQEMIVLAAVKQAMKGKTDAIKMIWDRMDGQPKMPIGGEREGEAIVFRLATGHADTKSDDIE